MGRPLMTPPAPTLQHWSSAIGLFIINFGMLDLHVQDYLETNLPPDEFSRFRDRYFHDRIKRLKEHVASSD